MRLECSNLCEYTPNQLSLLIAGVDLKIKANKEFIEETIRWDELAKLHKELLKDLRKDIEDLYALRLALVTVHQAVVRVSQTIDC
jgi:hypothetical protein